MKKKKSNNFLFLSPSLTIKYAHLTKSDVKNIKYSLLHKICFSSLVVAILLLIVNLISLISMGIATNWHQIEEYGFSSLLGQIISLVGSVFAITLALISFFIKNTNIKRMFGHIANLLVYVVMVCYLFLSFYADVTQGFLSVTPTLSASVMLISFFLIIQPVFWIEAIVLDGIVSFGLIGLSIYFTNQYQMQSLMYYLFLAFLFPIVCYIIISILFYAETQRYCEELRNEALYNTAYYDELTLCKNRHALKEATQNYLKSWENNKDTSLLVMMFDIDDFKLYNDEFTHLGGDYCLKAIADCVKRIFPILSLDFYRYGGEEFLLLLEVHNQKQAIEFIEKVRLSIYNLNIPAAKKAPYEYVSISIGGTILNISDISDFNAAIKRADECLYQAKGNGKNISVLDGNIVS